MDYNTARPGLRVKTTKLGETEGMLVDPKYLKARCEGVVGTVINWVPGHGGNLWYVQHNDGSGEGAAYCLEELEPE